VRALRACHLIGDEGGAAERSRRNYAMRETFQLSSIAASLHLIKRRPISRSYVHRAARESIDIGARVVSRAPRKTLRLVAIRDKRVVVWLDSRCAIAIRMETGETTQPRSLRTTVDIVCDRVHPTQGRERRRVSGIAPPNTRTRDLGIIFSSPRGLLLQANAKACRGERQPR